MYLAASTRGPDARVVAWGCRCASATIIIIVIIVRNSSNLMLLLLL
jgi:hypothetical protein